MFSDANIRAAAEAISRAQLIAVSSGAGISKESGIPTFRDAQTGLWAQYDPEQLATPDAFKRNPDLVWSWYVSRHDLVAQCRPNPGHLALVEMEKLVPQLVILTQNVDGLHCAAGSADVVELHGSLGRFKCSADCQGSPTLVDLETIPHDHEHAPPCPHCGALIRPDVVWFGEVLSSIGLERAFDVAGNCQVMLVVGTSGMVQPAASFPIEARRAGATVIEVNLTPSQLTPVVDISLQGPSGHILPLLVDALKACRNRSLGEGD
ncbi:MAG: NAD-dependent deacylase [Anaerolineae bacterium]|nr:NAD-dependent deacylase [Anaerolineae bacterium]